MSCKQQFFNDIAEQWDGHSSPPDEIQKREQFVLRATQHCPTSILDAGCGTGILVPLLRKACPGAGLIELGFASRMLAINRRKHGDENIRYDCDALEGCVFPVGFFDLISCFNALPHFDIPRSLVRCAQLLKRGGRMAIGHLMSSDELNVFHSSLPGPVADDRLPCAAKISQMLAASGFQVLNSEERSGWYFILAEKRNRNSREIIL